MQRQQLNSMYWKNEMMNYDEQLYVKNVRKQRGISTIESREPMSTGLHWIEIISNWDGSEFFRKYPTSYLSCIFPSNAIVFHRIHLSTRSSCVRTQELLNTNETETPIDITWSCFDRPIWFFTILLGFFCVRQICVDFLLFRVLFVSNNFIGEVNILFGDFNQTLEFLNIVPVSSFHQWTFDEFICERYEVPRPNFGVPWMLLIDCSCMDQYDVHPKSDPAP